MDWLWFVWGFASGIGFVAFAVFLWFMHEVAQIRPPKR